MKKLISCISLFIMSLSLLSCSNNKKENIIYTSFYPIYDFTKRIVKDKYEVINLTSNGQEPHEFEPTSQDVVKMIDSKAIFINGLELESWTASLPKEIDSKLYKVTDNIEYINLNNSVDPHVWLSIKNAMTEMNNILNIMKDLDPDNYSFYQSNYDAEIIKFKQLDEEYISSFKEVRNNNIVVSHAAFSYLCKEYSLNQIYVSGLNYQQEPTAKEIENIISQIKQYNISTVFYEEMKSDSISKQIAKETDTKIEVLDTLESLSIDRINNNEDYLSVMKLNLNKLKDALNDNI